MQKGTPTSRDVPGLAVASQSVQESTAVQLLMDGRELRSWYLVLFVETPIRPNVHTVYAGAGPGLLAPILDAEQTLPRI